MRRRNVRRRRLRTSPASSTSEGLDFTVADLEWLMAANPDDNAEVAFWIGYCHHYGTGVQRNHDTAVLYFRKAADRNHGKALWHLAWCYDKGLGVSEDKTRATQLRKEANTALQSALQEDDAEAQYLLGYSYNLGYGGLNQDLTRVFSLYHQAAQQGHVVGQYFVGLFFKCGYGVTKDWVQAAGWYGQAARQKEGKKLLARVCFDNLFAGNVELKDQLAAVARGARDRQETFLAASALVLFWGQTICVNYFPTVQMWQEIADKCTNRVPSSWKPRILAAGHRLESEETAARVRRKADEAKRKKQQSDDFPLVSAANTTMYCLDLTAADLAWLLASNPDDPEVAFWIGYCHYWGTGGVKKSFEDAVLWFQNAANHNHAKALWRLVWCYQYGWGVTKDETRATQLRKQANAALESVLQEDCNDPEAQYLLGLSCDHGYGGLNVDEAKAFSLYQQAAQQGHFIGQWKVGVCFKGGLGVAKDWVQAAGWFGQAARQGDSSAAHLDHLFAENGELKDQLAFVGRGALDQQDTFLAASALTYYWTQTEGANSPTAQEWQEIANQCTNRVPSSWKPRILTDATIRRREEERRRREEEARKHREEERRRREEAAEEQRRREEEARKHREEERRRQEEAAERKRREAEEEGRRNPLGKLQTIQKNDDTSVRQAQLVALVQELQDCCNTRSANKPEVFRVLGYCHDHGIGMEQEDQEQAFRLYVKADELVGIKPAAGNKRQGWFGFRGKADSIGAWLFRWFGCFRRTNGKEASAATTETGCSSAEWLYWRVKDERVTCYETRFELDATLKSLSTTVTRGKKARDSATIKQAIRCEFELAVLQGLLRMDQFTSEAELRLKAHKLTKQADRAMDKAKRLPLFEELERVKAQLKKEVEARKVAELQRRHGAASASHPPPPVLESPPRSFH